MSKNSLPGDRLTLKVKDPSELKQMLDQMTAEERSQVSADWLAMVESASEPSCWIHGFTIQLNQNQKTIGNCGFKGPPSPDGKVEIAYGVDPDFQNLGYATEAAELMTRFALEQDTVETVLAHTLPEKNASTRVLEKCSFVHLGEVIDPDDGKIWRWERTG